MFHVAELVLQDRWNECFAVDAMLPAPPAFFQKSIAAPKMKPECDTEREQEKESVPSHLQLSSDKYTFFPAHPSAHTP